MDAIFQYSTDYMEEPLTRFNSYMEKASLQLRVELEEYVESTLNTSSSIFIIEGADSFFEKFKKAIKLIIERLKEFIRDTKVNFQKYKKDKASEEKIDKLASIFNKSDKLKSLKVKYKDYSPKAKFIKSEKEALQRMVRKKGTTKEELKIFMDRYKNELSTMEKVGIAITTVSAITIISKSFIKGLQKGFNSSIENAEDTIEELGNGKIIPFPVKESTEVSKEDISKDSEMMVLYARYLAEICTDEIKVQRETLIEFDKTLYSIEKEVENYFENMEGDW